MISLLVKRSIVRSFRRFNLIQMIIIQWLLVTPLVPSSRFDLLRLSVDVCIVAYLLIFCTYYKVFPRKKLKRFWIPYLLYMIGVYLYIVSENDWDFSIVTIDYYMLLGWLIPLGGLCFFAVMFIYYYFTSKRSILKVVRYVFSGGIFKQI